MSFRPIRSSAAGLLMLCSLTITACGGELATRGADDPASASAPEAPAANAAPLPKTAPISAASASATPQKFACPMHPEVVSDHPGKCPKCGMDLREVAP